MIGNGTIGGFSDPSGAFGNGTGSHSITFSKPGVYTYTMRCRALTHALGMNIYSGATTDVNDVPSDYVPYASDSATITVGDPYTLQVNGNSSVEGYINADGNVYTKGSFIENGRHVCLQDGTNCPPPKVHIVNDSSGNISFYLPSYNTTTSTTGHDSIVMYLDSAGLHISGGLYVGGTLYHGTTAHSGW